MKRLPIDVIDSDAPGPPRFKWERMVETPLGRRVVACDGCLPATIENAVLELIRRYKQLQARVLELEGNVSKKPDARPVQQQPKKGK